MWFYGMLVWKVCVCVFPNKLRLFIFAVWLFQGESRFGARDRRLSPVRSHGTRVRKSSKSKKLETTSLLRSGHRRRMLALDSGHVSDVTSKSKLTKSIFEFFFFALFNETMWNKQDSLLFFSSTQPQALKGNGNQVNHFKCKLVFLQDEFRL